MKKTILIAVMFLLLNHSVAGAGGMSPQSIEEYLQRVENAIRTENIDELMDTVSDDAQFEYVFIDEGNVTRHRYDKIQYRATMIEAWNATNLVEYEIDNIKSKITNGGTQARVEFDLFYTIEDAGIHRSYNAKSKEHLIVVGDKILLKLYQDIREY